MRIRARAKRPGIQGLRDTVASKQYGAKPDIANEVGLLRVGKIFAAKGVHQDVQRERVKKTLRMFGNCRGTIPAQLTIIDGAGIAV